MLAWFRSHGELLRVGRAATAPASPGRRCPECPCEVTGPDPAASTQRRLARDVESKWPRIAAARWKPLRVLRTTRKTAVKCRRAALQQLHNTIVAAPDEVRDQIRNLTRMRRLRICAAWRPDAAGYRDPAVATKLSLKSLAHRVLALNDEIAELDRFIAPLVKELAPDLLKLEGVGFANAGELRITASETGCLRSKLRDVVRRLPAPRLKREDATPPP